ncbi:MAG: acyl carrier protein [Terriglobales bacterium]|jgi:acyl carrier protein
MTNQNSEKLAAIFRAVFRLPATVNVFSLSQASNASWDSLAHVSLIAALEDEFNLSFQPDETLRMVSYGATLLILQGKGL